jgi:hypothetical protein
MANDLTNLPSEAYTTDYLDSIRARFPELAQKTRPELISVLEAQKERKQGEYEFVWKDALDQIEGEALLDYPDDSLFTYLFEELPDIASDKITSWIAYVMQKNGTWDLVLWSRSGPRSQGRAETIWQAVFAEHYSFIQEGKEPHFKRWEDNKYVVILSVKKNWEQDVYWRMHYTLAPQLIQVPDKWAMIMDGMLFQKDLNVAEFKENFAKCTTTV